MEGTCQQLNSQSQLNPWANLFSETYQTDWVLKKLRDEFLVSDYIKLPNLFSLEAFTTIKSELKRLEPDADKKNFIMEGYETPRILSVLGGRKILELSPMLRSLYSNKQLKSFLQIVAGTEIYPCLHPEEVMVANFLLGKGATHGWHLDDPTHVLVVILEAPCAIDGGVLELIPNWKGFLHGLGVDSGQKVEPFVELADRLNLIQPKHHASGDVYLLRADRCLHRVTELRRENASRIVLNLSYESTPNPTYGHTATRLYGEI